MTVIFACESKISFRNESNAVQVKITPGLMHRFVCFLQSIDQKSHQDKNNNNTSRQINTSSYSNITDKES